MLSQTRIERMREAAQSPCLENCQNAWRTYAERVVAANALDAPQFFADVLRSISHGRHENVPVVTLVGKFGGEGKSFLFAPLRHMFGKDYVQDTPQPGSFPLLGLETKRIVILDEWDFDDSVIPFSTQLLWFEGKSFNITRPQNNDYTGHLPYQGSAPIFVTCKEKALAPIYARAQCAFAQGTASQDTMLLRRMRLYWLSHPLPVPMGLSIAECPNCFARMAFLYGAPCLS